MVFVVLILDKKKPTETLKEDLKDVLDKLY